jgi:hypothetical protein
MYNNLETYGKKIPVLAKSRTGITAIFVDKDGNVNEIF